MNYMGGQPVALGDRVLFLDMTGEVVVLNSQTVDATVYGRDGWVANQEEFVVIKLASSGLVCFQNTEYNEHLSLVSRLTDRTAGG